MNKKNKSVLLLLLTLSVCSSVFIGCNITNSKATSNSNSVSKAVLTKRSTENIKKANTYDISAKLNVEKKTLSCTEKVNYVNNSKSTLKEVYFHLYPNAYKNEATAPALFGNKSAIYPFGFTPGFLDFTKLTLNEKNPKYNIEGVDQTILKITLNTALKPGDEISLDMNFDLTIPAATDRFGGYEGFFNFGNWYPIASVYDDHGWNLDPYYKIGDPFYSDIATYNVKLEVPKGYTVAATGEPNLEASKENSSGDFKTFAFKESNVRDFAWVASDKFVVQEKEVEGTKVKCYGVKENVESNTFAMTTAVNSIKTFNEAYGKYPYKNYSVVCTNFPSGMEYPELVFIGKQYYDKKQSNIIEKDIVHETAHQWWYGIVGNDEVKEAWLDESLTAYSEAVFFEKKENSKRYFDNTVFGYDKVKASLKDNEVILRPVSQFIGWNDYGPLIYSKGPIMVNTLRNEIGDEAFFKVMKNYYEKYKFKNAKTGDFIAVVEEVTGKKWDVFFQKWLLDKK